MLCNNNKCKNCLGCSYVLCSNGKVTFVQPLLLQTIKIVIFILSFFLVLIVASNVTKEKTNFGCHSIISKEMHWVKKLF